MADNTVVPKPEPLTEEQFRSTFLQSLNRLTGQHGDARVALWLGVTERQLRNIKAGSMPCPHRIWNLLAHDNSAHDELDRKFGARKVPEHAVCSTDPIAARMAGLLARVIDAERPDGDGGDDATMRELRGMDESDMRAVHRRLGAWIKRLEDYREGPELRAVRS